MSYSSEDLAIISTSTQTQDLVIVGGSDDRSLVSVHKSIPKSLVVQHNDFIALGCVNALQSVRILFKFSFANFNTEA